MIQHTLSTSTPRRVLAFSPNKQCVAVYKSVNAAAQAVNVSAPTITYACNGSQMSAGGFYWRYVYMEFQTPITELLGMSLQEYDERCCLTRQYYPTTQMTRKGMKYKQHIAKPLTPKQEEQERQCKALFYTLFEPQHLKSNSYAINQ